MSLPARLWLSVRSSSERASTCSVCSTHNCGFEGEAEGEREDVAVLLFAPRVLVHAVVRVDEDDETSLLERSPYRLEGVVVEALADTARAHDDALEVREGGDLLHCRDEGLGGRPRDEREEAEAVEPLEALLLGEGGPGRAVRLEVVVELACERVGGRGGEEVEPWIRGAAYSITLGSPALLDVREGVEKTHLTTDTSMACRSMNLSFSSLSQYYARRATSASAMLRMPGERERR